MESVQRCFRYEIADKAGIDWFNVKCHSDVNGSRASHIMDEVPVLGDREKRTDHKMMNSVTPLRTSCLRGMPGQKDEFSFAYAPFEEEHAMLYRGLGQVTSHMASNASLKTVRRKKLVHEERGYVDKDKISVKKQNKERGQYNLCVL